MTRPSRGGASSARAALSPASHPGRSGVADGLAGWLYRTGTAFLQDRLGRDDAGQPGPGGRQGGPGVVVHVARPRLLPGGVLHAKQLLATAEVSQGEPVPVSPWGSLL